MTVISNSTTTVCKTVQNGVLSISSCIQRFFRNATRKKFYQWKNISLQNKNILFSSPIGIQEYLFLSEKLNKTNIKQIFYITCQTFLWVLKLWNSLINNLKISSKDFQDVGRHSNVTSFRHIRHGMLNLNFPGVVNHDVNL